ncbi:hypothetical protein BBJ28_00024927 [Nothophytophthora sp. Chile5]|nr:hypothetical protein BBJ28_00024927 [Nothophytophthora sp. Chile5]
MASPTSALSSEPEDGPVSVPQPDRMQDEDFAQFMCFMGTYLRAVEDAREDHLFSDPFAEPLTRQIAPQLEPRLKMWMQRQPHPENFMALRTRYLDEAITQRNPSIRQVVLLGSGLDARVFRLASLRDCHVFEIDQSAELFTHKQAVLGALNPPLIAQRHDCLVADLNDFNWEENLLSSGFNPDIPTFWGMEGLLMYLTRASDIALLKTIDILSAPGSEVWADMSGLALLKEAELALLKDVNTLSKAELGKRLIKHGEDDVTQGIFTELPWELEVQAALLEGGTHFGREWVPIRTGLTKTPVPFSFVLAKKP